MAHQQTMTGLFGKKGVAAISKQSLRFTNRDLCNFLHQHKVLQLQFLICSVGLHGDYVTLETNHFRTNLDAYHLIFIRHMSA